MLHLASGHGQLAVVRYLVEHQANVNAANQKGKSPLGIAIAARQEGDHRLCAAQRCPGQDAGEAAAQPAGPAGRGAPPQVALAPPPRLL